MEVNNEISFEKTVARVDINQMNNVCTSFNTSTGANYYAGAIFVKTDFRFDLYVFLHFKIQKSSKMLKKSHQSVGNCKILLPYTQIRTLAKKPKSMACNHGDLVPTIVHSSMSNLTLNCLA